MDRRQFLGAVAIISSSGALASSPGTRRQGPFAPPSLPLNANKSGMEDEGTPKVGVVAIGSSGIHVLSRLHSTLPRLHRSVASDTNPFLLRRAVADRKVVIGNGSPVTGAPAVEEISAVAGEIANTMLGVTQLFILTDLGGATELALAETVASIMRHAQIMTICAVIDSLDLAGRGAHWAVQAGIDRLIEQQVPVVSLFQRRAGDASLWGTHRYPTPIPVATAFERLYRCMVDAQDWNDHSLCHLDESDVHSIFNQRVNRRMVIGYGAANGPYRTQLAAHRATSHPLFAVDRDTSDTEVLVSIEAGQACPLTTIDLVRVFDSLRESLPYCFLIPALFRNPLLMEDLRITLVAPEAQSKNIRVSP